MNGKISLREKAKAYMAFSKMRLSMLVIVSAISGYLMAPSFNTTHFIYLIIGGFLVTTSSNGFNQIIEKEIDKKMNRTMNRPLPTGKMSVLEAMILAILMGGIGIFLLSLINTTTALLGFLSLFSYVALYTPLKRVTPWAVFVGAFPGAMPPMLGYIAATGTFSFEPGILFLVQFMWQFPHFWAIAWVAYDDYLRAGIELLPSRSGKTKVSAFQILVYSLVLIPTSMLPWIYGITGVTSVVIAALLGFMMFYQSYRLYTSLEDVDAKKLMFASFIYLPIIQFAYVFNLL